MAHVPKEPILGAPVLIPFTPKQACNNTGWSVPSHLLGKGGGSDELETPGSARWPVSSSVWTREAVQTWSMLGEGVSRNFLKVKRHIDKNRRGDGGDQGDEDDKEPLWKNVRAEP